ncbi:hypothetical protein C6T52_29120 [Burkholderia multivorans]|nr:hypothetical protein C6T52_29120 [Burkholderia multivorans]
MREIGTRRRGGVSRHGIAPARFVNAPIIGVLHEKNRYSARRSARKRDCSLCAMRGRRRTSASLRRSTPHRRRACRAAVPTRVRSA